MLDYNKFEHHPVQERIVDVITKTLSTDIRSFFRVHAAFYFTMMASSMRTMYLDPGATTHARPINMYAINLAPSGFGKGYSTKVLEKMVTNQFQERFVSETWPVIVHHNLATAADYRARNEASDPDAMRLKVEKEFERMGNFEFAFALSTPAALQQYRSKLLLAGVGSINMICDEIGSNLFKAKEAFPALLELYDGEMKMAMTKNTAESIRPESIAGITPTNAMMFGVPVKLLDQGKNEDEFNDMNEQGFARRSVFCYVSDEDYAQYVDEVSAEELLRKAKEADIDNELADISDLFRELADPLNANNKLPIPDNTALLLFTYQNECKRRCREIPMHQHVQRYEMEHRSDKAKRLAGAYAFVDSASEITIGHMKSAIKLIEESGEDFRRIQQRDASFVKLAKFLGSTEHEVTKVSLREQLPFFKGGTQADRDIMLTEAIAWGYTNNIAITRRFARGVEFYSGKLLKSNDLTKLNISFGMEQAYNYTSQQVPWNELDKLAQTDGVNWVNHLLENGFDSAGHRHNDNCIPGFNMVVLDVDDGMTIQQAKYLMSGYKAFYYVTKRHTPDQHRFRIILPLNYTLELEAEDFAEFMDNLYEWLPFACDEKTGQRSRKWLSNNGHHMYTDGKLLDALPFIPRTDRQVEVSERLVDLSNLGGLERWFIQKTSIGQHNRNHNLLRYALLLVDAGMDALSIKDKLLALNNQLDKPIGDNEINDTMMKTVTKKIQTRVPPKP